MLKKNAPSWGEKQDEEVRKIKEISKNVKSLYIPSDGKKILQTIASNEYRSAVLFEEKDGHRKLCGYASGKFKDSEQLYHSTFKEILAMNMKAIPKMFQINANIISNPQLLRWAQWFSPYKFQVNHLKGKDNILADFLSRLEEFSKRFFPAKLKSQQ
uniref:Reverse transcriptase/retrotransposon-derived protein RNase H-like domain-containing protein n=1 Tax=Nicotiana tabacum TaxID=4097 RepID=A0A1S4AA46_TOBAC|nr:PREDICTED: uncharacterized protein LOC107795390 [Nicotiana tabacum]